MPPTSLLNCAIKKTTKETENTLKENALIPMHVCGISLKNEHNRRLKHIKLFVLNNFK